MNSFFTNVFIAVIRIYQRTLSPDHGPLRDHFRMRGIGCRHALSCSEYAVRVMREKGAGAGFYVSLRRVLACHPWAK